MPDSSRASSPQRSDWSSIGMHSELRVFRSVAAVMGGNLLLYHVFFQGYESPEMQRKVAAADPQGGPPLRPFHPR